MRKYRRSSRSTAVVCHADPSVAPAVDSMLDLNGFTVVGRAPRGADVVALAEEHLPALVVLDLSLAGEGGLSIIRAIHDVSADTAVVVLSPLDSLAFLARAAGAVEVFTDDDLSALRRILPLLRQEGETGSEIVNAPPS